MQKGQIALGAFAVILVAALYFGGKTANKKEKSVVHTEHGGISFDEYEQQQIAKLADAEKQQAKSLAEATKNAPEQAIDAKKKAYANLVDFWKNNSNPALAAYYIYQAAKLEETKTALVDAGDALVTAYKSTEDSVILNNLITFALQSYEKAVEKDSNDWDLKIKLADAYVNGSQEPMKGIGILRDLESKHPENIKVLMSMSRMSIQSGQYDKAKERLNKILKLEPQNTEAMYFLAITEAQLGHNDEAIRLFEMCKILVNNADFNKEIDEIVNSLKNKKI